jgi:uncharacterized protein (DUF1778 family)
MAVTEKKEEHISTVVPIHIYQTLALASEIQGETLKHFLIQAAFEKAKMIIEQERVITVSTQDANTFFQAIDDPPHPSKKLINAIQAYKNVHQHAED